MIFYNSQIVYFWKVLEDKVFKHPKLHFKPRF